MPHLAEGLMESPTAESKTTVADLQTWRSDEKLTIAFTPARYLQRYSSMEGEKKKSDSILLKHFVPSHVAIPMKTAAAMLKRVPSATTIVGKLQTLSVMLDQESEATQSIRT